MIWAIAHYIKLAVVFGLLWSGFWVYSSYGCVRIKGSEMTPAVEKDKTHLLRLGKRSAADLKRGDIVHYSHNFPKSGQPAFSGRVIGIPGDRITLENGSIDVNGKTVPRKATFAGVTGYRKVEDVIVPKDSLYIIGDNDRTAALYDSRAVGPIHVSLILGTFGE